MKERENLPSGVHVRQLGSTGLKQSHGWLLEEFHPKLSGRQAIKVYREMSDNSDIIGSWLLMLEFLIKQAPRTVKAADESPQGLFAKHLVETCIDDMSHTFEEFLAEVVTMAWAGYALHEIVYKIRRGEDGPFGKSRHCDGMVGWRKLPTRSQDTIERWEFADDGGILAAEQRNQWAQNRPMTVMLPMERALLFRTTSRKNNPEGRSLLRNAYRSWWFLKRIQEFEAIGIEKDMAGVLLLRAPLEYFSKGADSTLSTQLEEFREMVEKSGRNEFEGFVFPAKMQDGEETGFDLDTIKGGGRKPIDTDPIVQRYESRIAISFLGEAALLGMMGNTGSWALADVKDRIGSLIVRGFGNQIESTMNRFAIPRLMQVNKIPQDLSPEIELGDVKAGNVLEIAAQLSGLTSMGHITPTRDTEAYLRKELGLPELDEISPGQLDDAIGLFQEGDNASESPQAQQVLRDMAPTPDDTGAKALEDSMTGLKGEDPVGVIAQDPDPEAMSADDAAAFLNVSRSSIMRACRSGKLPGAKIGNNYRILKPDLLRFMGGGF